jgi:hypothetical protein
MMTNKIPPPPPTMTHKILKNNTIENIMTFMKTQMIMIKRYFTLNLLKNTKIQINY